MVTEGCVLLHCYIVTLLHYTYIACLFLCFNIFYSAGCFRKSWSNFFGLVSCKILNLYLNNCKVKANVSRTLIVAFVARSEPARHACHFCAVCTFHVYVTLFHSLRAVILSCHIDLNK